MRRLVPLAAGLITGVILLAVGNSPSVDAAATITVNSSADVVSPADNVCTLREAIISANSNNASGLGANECDAGMAGNDLIVIAGVDPVLAGTPLPDIAEDLTIEGDGTTQIDGNALTHVFEVTTNADIEVRRLTITNGYSDTETSAIIYSGGGTFLLDSVAVTANVSEDDLLLDSGRAAILVSGSGELTLINSYIANNRGGIGVMEITGTAATVNIEDTVIEDNQGEGIAGFDNHGTLMLTRTELYANTAGVAVNLDLVFGGVGVLNNRAGASALIVDSHVAENVITSDDNTNGLFNNAGEFEMRRSSVINNTSLADAFDTEIFLLGAGTGTIVNTTISGNSPGAIGFYGGDMTLLYNTITDNTYGLRSFVAGGTIGGNIIAGNDEYSVAGPGSIVSQGYSVLGPLSDSATNFFTPHDTDAVNVVDPLLGPLSVTIPLVHPLLAGSLAVDRVVAPLSEVVATDQHGTSRPVGLAPDAGAFESSGLDGVFCMGRPVTHNLATNATNGRGSPRHDVMLGTPAADTIRPAAGDDLVCAGAGNDVVIEVTGSNEIYGEDGNDRLHGGSQVDRIFGGSGNDIVRGDEGNDYVEGGSGTDVMYGETGDDEIHGGLDRDILVGDIGDDQLFGNSGRDSMYGGPGADLLKGGPDTDFIRGDSGDDVLFAGTSGNDRLVGGLGNDTLDASETTGSTRLLGEAGNDIFIGSNQLDRMWGHAGNDVMNAGGYHDLLRGGDGNDEIHGEDGRDTIDGGAGDDDLFGGAGNADKLVGGDDIDHCDGGPGIADFANATCETTANIP